MELSCFVFGRKMSEGINFANEMARFVFIVGFPYPDITESNKWTGELRVPCVYQNLCMRAVNQGIGRAIRPKHGQAKTKLGED